MNRRGALALAAASVAAGLLNYLFQVHAAAVLDARAFGALSTWLANVTLVSAVGPVVQFVALDWALTDATFAKLSRAAGAFSLVALGGHALLPGPAVALAATSVISAILVNAILGQLQRRLRLSEAAVAIVVTAGVRFAVPFAWARDARAHAFYLAHATSAFAGAAVASALILARPPAARPTSAGGGMDATGAPLETDGSLRLARPMLLALATMVFPIIDVFAISATNDDATTGAYSRVALAGRIVFFGGAGVLQVVLPHRLHAGRVGERFPTFVVTMDRWLLPLMIAGAAILAAVLDLRVLGAEGEQRVWLYASCVSAALLVAILAHLQRLAATNRLRVAAACVAGVVGASGAGAAASVVFGEVGGVTRYVVVVLIGDALVLAACAAFQMLSRGVRPRVPSRP